MFWSACCLAFYGVFLRVREFSSSVPFNSNHDITFANTSFCCHPPSQNCAYELSSRKQTPSGKDVISTWQGPLARLVLLPPCLHTSPFVVHLQSRLFFLWSNRSPLTAPQVNFNLRDLLSRAGVPGYFFRSFSDRRSNSRECRIT
jgi:hypothetical protein